MTTVTGAAGSASASRARTALTSGGRPVSSPPASATGSSGEPDNVPATVVTNQLPSGRIRGPPVGIVLVIEQLDEVGQVCRTRRLHQALPQPGERDVAVPPAGQRGGGRGTRSR